MIVRILGWSSLVSVAVVMVAWLVNYPLIQSNISVGPFNP